MKYIDSEEYPATYKNVLTPEQRVRLAAWFKCKQNQVDGFIKIANQYPHDDVYHVYYIQESDKVLKEIDGAVYCLREIGIWMEYNWVGHREEWFMATEYDAEMQNDYLADCR